MKKDKLTDKEKDLLVTLEVCYEMLLRNIKFKEVDIEKSSAEEFLVAEDGILPPFVSIPGLGEVVANNIAEERSRGRFDSVADISARCFKVSEKTINGLREAGALGDLPLSSQLSFF